MRIAQRLCDQSRCKNDSFNLSAALLTNLFETNGTLPSGNQQREAILLEVFHLFLKTKPSFYTIKPILHGDGKGHFYHALNFFFFGKIRSKKRFLFQINLTLSQISS